MTSGCGKVWFLRYYHSTSGMIVISYPQKMEVNYDHIDKVKVCNKIDIWWSKLGI